MAKIRINVDGVETEVDLETLDKETAESLGINIRDEVKNELKKGLGFNKVKNKISAITPFVSLIAFFLTGKFIDKAWSWNWSFFLLIPLVSILLNLNFKKPKKLFSSALSLIVIAAYLVTGILYSCWSWNWVLFFVFPIIWILCGE
jgi:hypothetical protein